MKDTYSAGGVILNKDGRILLINEGGDFWGIPKGRQGRCESLLETAKREIKEEAGFDQLNMLIELGTYERHPNNSGHEDTSELKHITLFLFRTNQNGELSNVENNIVRWVELSQAVELLTHPKDRQFLRTKLPVIKELLINQS